MPSALQDLALVHHDNLVAVADGTQPVGYDNLCRSHTADAFHHLVLGFRVEGTCGLVHDEDGRFLCQGCCHFYALPLSTAEVLASPDDFGTETFGTAHDVGTYLCIVAGHHHRKVLDAGIPHADVLRHGIVEKHHVLVDDGHRVCQFLIGYGFDRSAIEEDFSAPRFVKAADEFSQSRFSATACADEGDRMSRFYA